MNNNKKYALVFCGTKEKYNAENRDEDTRWYKSLQRGWNMCRTRARVDGYNVVSCWCDSKDNDIRKKFEEDGSYIDQDELLPPEHYKIDAIYVNEDFRAVRTAEVFAELQDYFQQRGTKIVVCESEQNCEGYDLGDFILGLIYYAEKRLSRSGYSQLLNYLSHELVGWKEYKDKEEKIRTSKVDN